MRLETKRGDAIWVTRLRSSALWGVVLRSARTELTDWLRGRLAMEDAHDARPEGTPLSATCPYGTRVDYVLVGPRSPVTAAPGTYRVLDAISEGLTDHDAVTVDLVPRPAVD